jgi:hypothetical protein
MGTASGDGEAKMEADLAIMLPVERDKIIRIFSGAYFSCIS